PRHAEIVGVFAAARRLFRRVNHGGGLADDAELAHFALSMLASSAVRVPSCSAAMADRIASYIWLYPVQRQRLLLNAVRTSASEGSGFSARSDFTVMMKPGVQNPHCA